MKIGILTYPLNNNYGCYLQSYALLHYLLDKKYDVKYIYRRRNKPSTLGYLNFAFRTLLRNILTMSWKSPIMNYEKEYMLNKGYRMFPFFQNYVQPRTKIIYSTKALKNECEKFDVIIVGSDQVWRAEILPNIEDYFLTFLGKSKIRRISYAASFGKDAPGFTDDQQKNCGNAIREFTAISLREESGIKIIKRYGWDVNNCCIVVDPTMLLNRDCYAALIKLDKCSKTTFGYILDQTNEKKMMLKFASEFLNTESCNFLDGSKNKDFVYPPVEDWLAHIFNANFIITDSYHGAVFSIICNIPFAVIVNQGRGAARFDTLLKAFGLTDRIVNDLDELKRVLTTSVQWDVVNRILDNKKKEAAVFLSKNLKADAAIQ